MDGRLPEINTRNFRIVQLQLSFLKLNADLFISFLKEQMPESDFNYRGVLEDTTYQRALYLCRTVLRDRMIENDDAILDVGVALNILSYAASELFHDGTQEEYATRIAACCPMPEDDDNLCAAKIMNYHQWCTLGNRNTLSPVALLDVKGTLSYGIGEKNVNLLAALKRKGVRDIYLINPFNGWANGISTANKVKQIKEFIQFINSEGFQVCGGISTILSTEEPDPAMSELGLPEVYNNYEQFLQLSPLQKPHSVIILADDNQEYIEAAKRIHTQVYGDNIVRVLPLLTLYNQHKCADSQNEYERIISGQKNINNWQYGTLEMRHKTRIAIEETAGYPYIMDNVSAKHFVQFRHNTLHDTVQPDDNWKVHISVKNQGNNVERAWNVIFPILAKYKCEHFKVVSLASANSVSGNQQRDKDRVLNGAQITLYIRPELAWKYQLALLEVEEELVKAGLPSPGIIPESDCPLGRYTSARFAVKGESDEAAMLPYDRNKADLIFCHLDFVRKIIEIKKQLSQLTKDNKSLILSNIMDIIVDMHDMPALHFLFLNLLNMIESNTPPEIAHGNFRLFNESRNLDADVIPIVGKEVIKIIQDKVLELSKNRSSANNDKSGLNSHEDKLAIQILSYKYSIFSIQSPLREYESLKASGAIRMASRRR